MSLESKHRRSSRRKFLGQAFTAAGTAIVAPKVLDTTNVAEAQQPAIARHSPLQGEIPVRLTINQQSRIVQIEPRVTLLDVLHPVQAAFIENDGFQCGYCTPGQICASVALLDEINRGCASAVTRDLNLPPQLTTVSEAEIKERLSGNLCRCSAYNGIVAAVQQAIGQSPPDASATVLVEEVG